MNDFLRNAIFEKLRDQTIQANNLHDDLMRARRDIKSITSSLANYEKAMAEVQKEFGFVFKTNDIESDPRGAFEKCIQRYELKDPEAKDGHDGYLGNSSSK